VAGDEMTRQWRKSSWSETSACVEVRMDADNVWVRRSTDPDGRSIRLSCQKWDAFLAGIQRGEF
jgi:Domain of unknown function (DUF397)